MSHRPTPGLSGDEEPEPVERRDSAIIDASDPVRNYAYHAAQRDDVDADPLLFDALGLDRNRQPIRDARRVITGAVVTMPFGTLFLLFAVTVFIRVLDASWVQTGLRVSDEVQADGVAALAGSFWGPVMIGLFLVVLSQWFAMRRYLLMGVPTSILVIAGNVALIIVATYVTATQGAPELWDALETLFEKG